MRDQKRTPKNGGVPLPMPTDEVTEKTDEKITSPHRSLDFLAGHKAASDSMLKQCKWALRELLRQSHATPDEVQNVMARFNALIIK